MCNVSFATGWTRDYVLHSLTFAELVRYAEYAVEWAELQSRFHASSVAKLFAPGAGSSKSATRKRRRPETVFDDKDDGVAELIRRNQPT